MHRSSLLLVAVACSAPAAPAPAPPAPPPAAPATAPAPEAPEAPAPPAPLVIPVTVHEPAPWLESPAAWEWRPPDPLDRASVVAIGARTALIRTQAGYFAVSLDRGVSGPLRPPPQTSWLGLGDGDAVLAATGGGALYRAADPGAATDADAFEHLATVEGATSWDAAGRHVIAATSWDEVLTSSDGGRRFRRRQVAREARVEQVLVRADGAAVARARDERSGEVTTYVARGHGPWRWARYQPASLVRRGAWIAEIGTKCQAVLARDGARWLAIPAPEQRRPWTVALRHSEGVAAYAPRPHHTLVDPPAPARGEEVTGAGPACPLWGIGRGTGTGALGTLAAEPGDPLRWLRGTAGAPTPPTASAVRLLSDGTCAESDVEADASDGRCAPGAPLARVPHAVVLDREALAAEVLALPEGCTPAWARNAAGMGLLGCHHGDTTRLYTPVAGAWHLELDAGARLDEIALPSAAADGTIGLYPPCPAGTGCSVWVRAPLAAGTPSAWRKVAGDGAVAHRVAPGGAVLTVIEEQPGEVARIALRYDDGDGARTLVEGVVIDRPIRDLRIDDGRALLSGWENLLEPYTLLVMSDGSLTTVRDLPDLD